MKDFLKKVTKFFSKLVTRFSNYKNTKKWFVLYLIILALFLLFAPVIGTSEDSYRMINFSWASSFIVLLAVVALFCWNLSVSFKNWVINVCSLREDEPLVDFGLLWMIACVFM